MPNQELSNLRRDYTAPHLSKQTMMANPIDQFENWLDHALESDILDPHAATLCTTSPNGIPSGRILLIKGLEEDGFIFYTNYDSEKGQHIAHNPVGSLIFYWDCLNQQIRATGKIEKISKNQSEAYFQSRPFESKVMSSISPQSHPIPNRETLDSAYKEAEELFNNKEVPLPENWGGYKLIPNEVEFWQGRPSRLHDRIRYTKKNGQWIKERLAP